MKIMAVDYGDARTGLAVCDRTETLASPVGIIEEKSLPKVAEKIVYATREFEVGMVVLGLPVNMNGSEGPRAEKTYALSIYNLQFFQSQVLMLHHLQVHHRCLLVQIILPHYLLIHFRHIECELPLLLHHHTFH